MCIRDHYWTHGAELACGESRCGSRARTGRAEAEREDTVRLRPAETRSQGAEAGATTGERPDAAAGSGVAAAGAVDAAAVGTKRRSRTGRGARRLARRRTTE